MTAPIDRSSDPYDRVWQRIRYGRRYSEVFELARDIKRVRSIVNRSVESEAAIGEIDPAEGRIVEATARALLKAAATSSKKLREVAAALDAEKRKDPVQVNILRAYQDCSDRPDEPPTLAEVKRAFKERFRMECGRSDQSLRKTLRMLGLPLGKARRGRPIGSSSQIGNPSR